jgi:hypothetical protein
MAFFPTHWRIFAIVWLVLAVLLWRHEQCCLASDAEQRVCKSAFQREQIIGWNVRFWKPLPRLPVPFKSESVPVRVLGRSLVTPFTKLRQTSPDPTGLLTFARLFLSQRRDGIALPLGKCRAGRWRLFSRFSLRVSGTLWEASSAARLPNFCIRRN